jgi:hypothetical protein
MDYGILTNVSLAKRCEKCLKKKGTVLKPTMK